MDFAQEMRVKARGTTDAVFWNAAADEIDKLRAALSDALEVGSHLMSGSSYEKARALVLNVESERGEL